MGAYVNTPPFRLRLFGYELTIPLAGEPRAHDKGNEISHLHETCALQPGKNVLSGRNQGLRPHGSMELVLRLQT